MHAVGEYCTVSSLLESMRRNRDSWGKNLPGMFVGMIESNGDCNDSSTVDFLLSQSSYKNAFMLLSWKKEVKQ